MTETNIQSSNRGGFALVITLGLVALLLVIVLALTSLVKVDSTFSQTALHQAAARQNALLAHDDAVAQLQRHAGPDTRVSTTSGYLNGASQSHYTGVWDAATVPGSPPVTWLVSGNGGTNPLARM